MIILSATTDKLQVITSTTGSIDVHVSYVDKTGATTSGNVTPGRQNTAISTATTTDILAAPASGDYRNAKTINVRNAHASTSMDVTVQFNQNATLITLHKATLRAGEALEYIEGVGWYLLASANVATLFKVLSADDTGGQNIATAQPWFPTAGGVTVAIGTYEMTGVLNFTRSAGTTSHTTSQQFGGTATVSSIAYLATVMTGDADASAAANETFARSTAAAVVKAASTSATESVKIKIDGIVRFSAAGTFIPQFVFSATPGGTPTVKANSYFRLDYYGDSSVTQQGTWS